MNIKKDYKVIKREIEGFEGPLLSIKIEEDTIDLAKYVQKTVKNRFTKEIKARLGFEGWLGQEIFNSFLLELKIPNLYANPIYEKLKIFRQIRGKHFDFFIPNSNLGFVSVKTTPEGPQNIRFMANVDQWKEENHDVVVAIKIESVKESKAYICGWLKAIDVESLPKHDFKKGLAYWTYLDPKMVEAKKHMEIRGKASKDLKQLRSPKELLDVLTNLGVAF